MARSLARRSRAIAMANMAAGRDAALIIAARTQALLLPGEPMEKTREAQRMVAEKLDAAMQGALAAQAAWAAFMMKAAVGGVRTATDLSIELFEVAEAAARPARVKVRANARRLTRT